MPSRKQSNKEEAELQQLFDLLSSGTSASPYDSDGAFAHQIRRLPVGLRAMAATHCLDISLSLDDIGWHFLNFGEQGLVAETSLGLRELGLGEVALLFDEAYELIRPLLADIKALDGKFYDILRQEGKMTRIDELTDRAIDLIGEQGVYPHWIRYARLHPDRVRLETA